MSGFPEHICEYAKRLASQSPRFARQCRASGAEPKEAPERKLADPFGELSHAGKCPGLKQRFPDRVLIMTCDRCFMNCRHCTRRWLLGRSELADTPERLRGCVDYVRARPEVRDVLLSGGDVLTLDDRRVMEFVEAFSSLEQIDMVRLCTRALSVNPLRVTPELAKALGKSGKVWVNTQFNCADEVTAQAHRAAALLVEAGIPVSCQSVLLKGVNDSGAEMLKLLKALSAARIRPYYVFQCDPIAGIDHFRVSLEKARKIERYCAERIGGLALPRFVADIPGSKRKVPLDML